jgi:hypothetical protein
MVRSQLLPAQDQCLSRHLRTRRPSREAGSCMRLMSAVEARVASARKGTSRLTVRSRPRQKRMSPASQSAVPLAVRSMRLATARRAVKRSSALISSGIRPSRHASASRYDRSRPRFHTDNMTIVHETWFPSRLPCCQFETSTSIAGGNFTRRGEYRYQPLEACRASPRVRRQKISGGRPTSDV